MRTSQLKSWPIFILDRRNSTSRRGYDHRRNEDVCAVKNEEQDDWVRTTKCASWQVKWIVRECVTYETHLQDDYERLVD